MKVKLRHALAVTTPDEAAAGRIFGYGLTSLKHFL
jgi:hypothetical protein